MALRAEQDDPGAIQRFAIQMASLHDLSGELSVAEGIEELCERAVRLGRIVLGFDRIGIWFIDSEDPSILYGSFGTDESGRVRDERGIILHRSSKSLPSDFYEGKEPVYYLKGTSINPRFGHIPAPYRLKSHPITGEWTYLKD